MGKTLNAYIFVVSSPEMAGSVKSRQSSSGFCGRCRQSSLRRQRQLKPAAAYSFIQLIHSYTLCWPAVTPLGPPSTTRVCTLHPYAVAHACRLIISVLRLCHAHVGYLAAPLKVTTTLSALASRANKPAKPRRPRPSLCLG